MFAHCHQPPTPHGPAGGWAHGPEGLKRSAGPFHGACPDRNVNIDAQIAEDDKGATRWPARGTNTGAMRDVPPTGKSVVVTGANIARLANGQIVESWFNFDMLTLFRQLGLIPAPPQ